MTFQQGLQLATEIFEDKIVNLEKDYQEKHKEDFDRQKMNKYINRKLQKEIKIITCINLMPSISILKSAERFKY